MHNLKIRNAKLVWVSIFVLSTLAFSCVDENTVITALPSGPVNLPLYKNGDTITYNISGTVTSKEFIPRDTDGEYKITWHEETGLTDPFNSSITIENVLKESSSLTISGLGVFNSTRFITQDTVRCIITVNGLPADPPVPADQPCNSVTGVADNTNYGSIYLLAVEHNGNKYWATTDLTNLSSSNISPPLASRDVKIYNSPLSTLTTESQTVAYKLLANCRETQLCEESVASVRFNTLYESINSAGYPAPPYGRIETLVTTLTSHTITQELLVNPANILPHYKIDILSACDDPVITSSSGEFQVHPSVGNVFIRRSCDSVSGTVETYNLEIVLVQFGGSFILSGT